MKLNFLIFFSMFLSVYLGMHYYIYARISSGLALKFPLNIYVAAFFIVGALSFFIGEILSRQIFSPWVKPIVFCGSVWLGILSIALAVILLRDILIIFMHGRDFKYYSILVSLILIAAVSAFSIANVARGHIIKEVKVKINKLPSELSGFTIVQLSDIHLNYVKSISWIDKIVNDTNNLKPDLVLITGDLIDGDLTRVNGFCDSLKRLNAKYGVFAVTGNHEYYAGIERFNQIAKESNIRVLRNESVIIADSIILAGLNDNEGKRFQDEGPDLKKAISTIVGVDNDKSVILMRHRPEGFDEAIKLGVDLQLSGHTHSGQIPPMDLLVKAVFKYAHGLYKKGNSYIYTTSGTGTWGPPMRLSSRSEITRIVLE